MAPPSKVIGSAPDAHAAAGFRVRRTGRALARQWHWLAVGLLLGMLTGLVARQFLVLPRLSVEIVTKSGGLPNSPGPAPESPPADLADELRIASRLATEEALVGRAIAASGVAFTVDEVLAITEVLAAPASKSLAIHLRTPRRAEGLRFLDAWAREITLAMDAVVRESAAAHASALADRLRAADQALAALGAELSASRAAKPPEGAHSTPVALLRRVEELEAKARGLSDRLATADVQLETLRKEMAKFSPALVSAKEELYRALTRYTEAHPKVRELRATVTDLEKSALAEAANAVPDLGSSLTSPAGTLYGQWVSLRNERLGLAKELDAVSGAQAQLLAALPSSATNSVRQAELEARFTVLSKERVSLATALQELDLAPATATGRFALSGPPRLERPGLGPPARGPAAAAAGGAAGLLVALGLVLLLDLGRGRIYTAEDLQHASGLPVLGVLRPLEEMDPAAVERWAFQTFTRLKGRLTRSNDEALICGVISASSGEGRSTVARLLTEAASRQGYRVMSIAADPARDDHPGSPVASPGSDEPVGTSLLPAEISRAVASPEHAPGGVMRLPALGLTLDLRAQWREALERARNADRLVLVADLPPASSQNGVLLAESLPNLLWVAGQGAARLAETRAGVSLLEDSRCNLIGAIMNTIPKHVRKRPAWRPWGAGALALWLVQPSLQAQDTGSGPPAPAAPSLASPAATVPTTKTPKLAPWQERLALGPGDVMDISLYGQSDSLRNGLFIGPDGRLNYLEARDVEAVGLTVDELREKLEAILGKYHRTPRVVINPLAFNSKKYFILGNVQSVGPFPLNRPVTILEAVARAGGFVTSAHYRNVIVQADLGRSFLARTDASGAPTRVPVDFEAVLLRGDLSQNLTLNPGDYLYFPPIDVQEVYVLGAVNSPGVVPYTQEMTAIAAIVSRGSFAEKAYRGKILVCRGSLNAPQVFTVDANAILSARQRDFPLQNKDIVYVARRPFAKVEELTEQAITSFVHGLIWGFTQTRVIPQLPQP